MKPTRQIPVQQTYLPAELYLAATFKRSFRKVALTTPEEPERICGVALRVGYTGSRETDPALYRLRVKHGPNSVTVTLPGFFLLEDGAFRLYQNVAEDDHTGGETNL